MAKIFEAFEPIFGEAVVDREKGSVGSPAVVSPRRSFLFLARYLDTQHIEVVATDFGSNTLQRVLTVSDLDDLRDETGISGSWSDFVDYFFKSLSSDSVKLLLKDGATGGKLTAHKSKGLPRITFSLHRLNAALSSDAVTNLSMTLYGAFKDYKQSLTKEREKQLEMSRLLTSEKVKNEVLQKQLDNFTFKRKMHKSKSSDRTGLASDITSATGAMEAEALRSEMASGKETTKTTHRAAPLRRVKARGARLADTGD